jgi:pimeloyl-ACP methyl ester carboxylesterase
MPVILPLLAAAALATTAPATSPVEAPGPLGPLKGSLLMPAGKLRAAMLIIPGSGPTDRDGNNRLGIRAAPYRLLAEGLAAKGIASVRIDKRGMFESRAAIRDANQVTIADYAADAHAWAKAIRARTGAPCVWLLGHSEGGLIALAAAQDPADICGLVLVSAPGRRLGDVLRQQLRASPAFAPVLEPALANLGALEAGRRVEAPTANPTMMALFAPQVQGFLISLLSYDPAKLVGAVAKPVLIVQGERDLQVSLEDARTLAAADTKARLYLIPGANHVLKSVASDDRAANFATYGDPALPLAPGIVDTIAAFVGGRSTGR